MRRRRTQRQETEHTEFEDARPLEVTEERDWARRSAYFAGTGVLLGINGLAAAVALGVIPVHWSVHFYPAPPPTFAAASASQLASGPPLLPPTTTTIVVSRSGGRGGSAVLAGGSPSAIDGGGASGGGAARGGIVSGAQPAGTVIADSDARDAIAQNLPPVAGTTVGYLVVSQHDPTWALEQLVGDPEIYRVLQLTSSGWTLAGEGVPGSLCVKGLPAQIAADFSPIVTAC